MNWKTASFIALGIALLVLGLRPEKERDRAGTRGASFPEESLQSFADQAELPAYLEGTPLPSSRSGLKVTTWNLHWFPGHTPRSVPEFLQKDHIDMVVNTLRQLDADILCLQEIKDPDALKEIISALPQYKIQMVSNFKGNLEIAILSKTDSMAAFAEEFHEAENTPPRGFAFAAFGSGTDALLVYSVHLKSNVGGISATAPKREESARQIIDHAEKQRLHYHSQKMRPSVLVCGDFNTDPTRKEFHIDHTLKEFVDKGFVWSFRGIARKNAITWLSNGRYPDAVFDGFLFLPNEGTRFSRSTVTATERTVSDHRPVSIWVDQQ